VLVSNVAKTKYISVELSLGVAHVLSLHLCAAIL
jgi:hypothetical protein